MWGAAAADLLQGSGFLEYLKHPGETENKKTEYHTKDRRVL